MRIVHLLLTSSFAGSERHAIELANAQSQHHEVTLILRRSVRNGKAGGYAHRVDPRVTVLWVDRWLGRWQARRLVRQLRPDVAHAHLSDGSKALGGLRDLRGKVLRVATLHIRYKPQQHAHLDALVAIAPWQMGAIAPPLRAHTAQIDNWTLPYRPAPDARQRLRAEHGIAPDAWVFGSMGRMERSKGFDLLVDAFERAAIPGAHLVLVGQGAELEALRQRKVPGVILPGFCEQPQDWMAAFDGFISAAREESFGLVFLEAMAAGLPVIATATLGAKHLRTALGARMVPLQDVTAMADALHAVHAQRPPRSRRSMERFSIDAKLSELEAFYRREIAVASAE
ncbi:MAG: glycosyltransferase [Giesbergeria sp.]|nr:glycosyltransferase [Giesbergeria sp.]